ncbi:MAG: hypothetical protein ACKV2Q_26060 [Planctomycetaceae bacterium]
MRSLFRHSSRRHQRRLPSPLSAEVQSLEPRTLPAGTVTAVVSGGKITLTGDQNANHITIAATGTGITLTGTDGTLIRKGARTGTEFTVNSPNVTLDVTINLRGGNDELTVNVGTADLVIGRNLKIDAGAGDDTITVPDDTGSITINGTFTVDLGTGADTLTTTTPITVLGNVKITGSSGNDTVDLTRFEAAQHLTIETGSGDDAVVLRDSRVAGNVNVALSAGDDDLDTDNLMVGLDLDRDDRTVGGAAIFDGGSGSDELNLVDSVFSGIARISLQTGNDTLALDSEFRGVLEVTAGAGNDDVLIGNADFQAHSRINLGSGDDELTVDGTPAKGTDVIITLIAGIGDDTLRYNTADLATLGLAALLDEANLVFDTETDLAP